MMSDDDDNHNDEKEVLLVVYDLSRSRRHLSFEGPNHPSTLDNKMIIPHAALRVFGKEHHFFGSSSSGGDRGGGIRSVDPDFFHSLQGIDPIQTKRLGRTKVSRATFEQWCQKEASLKYNGRTYHRWHRNGNHFSQDAARDGLNLQISCRTSEEDQGTKGGVLLPTWIFLQVSPTVLPPQFSRKFHFSPSYMVNVGQTRMMMVRPVIEQLLVRQHPHEPLTSITKTLPSSPSTRCVEPVTRVGGAVYVSDNCPYYKNKTTTDDSGGSSSSSEEMTSTIPPKHPMGRPITLPPPKATSTTTLGTSRSLLTKYTKALLSNDTTSLVMCVAKLSPHFHNDPPSYHAIQTLSRHLLLEAGARKQCQSQQGTAAANHHHEHNTNDDSDSRQHVATAVHALWRLIQGDMGSQQQEQQGPPSSVFALLYLRIVVLSFSNTPAVQQVVCELMKALVAEGEDEDHYSTTTTSLLRSPVSKSLAWCVASNYAGSMVSGAAHQGQSQPSSPPPPIIPPWWVETALRDWNHDSFQVRQAACTFLYNYVICHGATLEEDEETVVSLVCSSLECLVEETDPTTRLRRLLVGARVVFGVHHYQHPCHQHTAAATAVSCNEMAKDLVQDLGFVGLLQELVVATTTTTDHHYHSDTLECQQLAFELMERLRN